MIPSTSASSRSLIDRVRRRAGDERGFTIIELLVAALVLAVGTTALLGSFDSSRRLATAAEMHATGNALAEKEVERISSQPWSSMALSSNPSRDATATPSNPTYYISTATCGNANTPASSPCYQWDWRDSTQLEPLAVDATNGADSATPTAWQTTVSGSSGAVRMSGSIYRYITWVKDPQCSATGCGGADDLKRITVAVAVTGLTQPIVMSTVVGDSAGGTKNPLTSGSVSCLDGTTTVQCVR